MRTKSRHDAQVNYPASEQPKTAMPSNLKLMAAELENLQADLSQYDEDNLPPTGYAVSTTESVLRQSGSTFRGYYPLGDVYANNGGMRVDWRADDRHVSLVVPPDSSGKSYIFWQFGAEYGGTYDVTGLALTESLKCLADGTIPGIKM
jgi:hypothetical protein